MISLFIGLTVSALNIDLIDASTQANIDIKHSTNSGNYAQLTNSDLVCNNLRLQRNQGAMAYWDLECDFGPDVYQHASQSDLETKATDITTELTNLINDIKLALAYNITYAETNITQNKIDILKLKLKDAIPLKEYTDYKHVDSIAVSALVISIFTCVVLLLFIAKTIISGNNGDGSNPAFEP
jgi:hypothetical protein